MISDEERREVARRLREHSGARLFTSEDVERLIGAKPSDFRPADADRNYNRLADLIEPIYKPDPEYEAWYNSLSHFGDERGGPSTIREFIEEIVWAALTVDLGPNGNTDSTGVDEGRVYTDKLFAEWEREALRLSGSIDRDALLALVDELEAQQANKGLRQMGPYMQPGDAANRIREALGMVD